MLLLQDGALVKSKRFAEHRYIGDPLNAVSLFNAMQADELIFLDISAHGRGRSIDQELVQEIGAEANMPFSVGGGLRDLESVRRVLAAGAEKVVLGTSALRDPHFVQQVALEFGSSALSICLDVVGEGEQSLVFYRGSGQTGQSALEAARLCESSGAGEIIVQSVERDGMRTGYDTALTREISRVVTVPVVCLGGAGTPEHLQSTYREAHLSGVAAGSLFVYHGSRQGVLINYPSRRTIHQWFRSQD